MSSKKELVLEENKKKMLTLLHEKKEFFQLKELEKLGPEKGINANIVKEVVKSLVDDGLVDADKIGTSIYYWAFESKALNAQKRKLRDLTEEYDEANDKLTAVEKEVKKLQVDREQTDARKKLLNEIVVLKYHRNEAKRQVVPYEGCDPETVKKLRKQTKELKDAANRWTDNVFMVKSWCKKEFGTEHNVIDKHFAIPNDFDYIQ